MRIRDGLRREYSSHSSNQCSSGELRFPGSAYRSCHSLRVICSPRSAKSEGIVGIIEGLDT
jgi:hypothetical protein